MDQTNWGDAREVSISGNWWDNDDGVEEWELRGNKHHSIGAVWSSEPHWWTSIASGKEINEVEGEAIRVEGAHAVFLII